MANKPPTMSWAMRSYPDSKGHGAIMGPISGRMTPVSPMLAPWILLSEHWTIIIGTNDDPL